MTLTLSSVPATRWLAAVQRQLRDLLWERAGVVRHEAGLLDGVRRVEEIKGALPDVDVRPTAEGWGDLAAACDLRAGVVTLRCALEERETRGCHNRSDFPTLDPVLQVNLHCQRVDGQALRVWSEPVSPVPADLRAWAEAPDDADLAGRLLE